MKHFRSIVIELQTFPLTISIQSVWAGKGTMQSMPGLAVSLSVWGSFSHEIVGVSVHRVKRAVLIDSRCEKKEKQRFVDDVTPVHPSSSEMTMGSSLFFYSSCASILPFIMHKQTVASTQWYNCLSHPFPPTACWISCLA